MLLAIGMLLPYAGRTALTYHKSKWHITQNWHMSLQLEYAVCCCVCYVTGCQSISKTWMVNSPVKTISSYVERLTLKYFLTHDF